MARASDEGLQEPLLGQTEESPASGASELTQTHLSIDMANSNDNEDCPQEESERLITEQSASRERLVKPLAFARTTPLLIKLILPVLIIACHGLFLYGQIKPMWRLSEHIDVNVWATAKGREAKIFMDALKLPHANNFVIQKDKNVKTFTYSYAIQELWKAQKMPGKFLPRLAAVLLFLFSGIWPHTKLLLLLLTWFFSKRHVRRKRILNTLGVLGKWSLVDVLVVCVMVGVLNLQWTIDGPLVLDRITGHLPVVVQLVSTLYDPMSICTKALKYSCHNPKKLDHILQCKACRSTVSTFFSHPDSSGKPILRGFESTGGGEAELFVAGLQGIYFFCGAVILSILLSLVVDWYDHIARLDEASGAEEETNDLALQECPDTEEVSTTPEISGTLSEAEENGRPSLNSLMQASGVDYRSNVDREYDEHLLHAQQDRGRLCRIFVSSVTATCILIGVTNTSLQRNVNGTFPTLIHEVVGIVWTKSYSFLELARTTGKAGGWDWMLMGTFAFFIVLGPLIRALLCLVVMVRRAGGQHGRKIITIADFLGAFCAWEVFGAALVMVDLLMPAITSTILIDPRCSTLTDDSSCLEVEFNLLHNFGWVLVGGVLLVLISTQIRLRHALY